MRLRLLGFLAIALFLLLAQAAVAKPFPVTNLASDGENSLRQRILAANSNPGADTIPIEVTGTIQLETALPTITDDVEVLGPGAGSLAVSRPGPGAFRIFSVGSAVTASFSDLTIRNGLSNQGAGILSQGGLVLNRVVVTANEATSSGGTQAVAQGGGVLAFGPLTIRDSTISDNQANADGGTSQTVAQFGGVGAFGETLIDRSTISGNTVEAVSTGSQVVAQSAGISVSGLATIASSTISANSATAADGASQTVAKGGGISSFSNLTLSSSTVTANAVTSTESATAANLNVFGANLIRNTIVSAPQGGANCVGATTTSGGFNIEDGANCGFSQPTDRSSTNPGIGLLENNGGPTFTHALLPGSAAIDSGNSFGATADQRGLPRPLDLASAANASGSNGSDVGAFELQGTAASPPPGPGPLPGSLTVNSDRTAPNTRITRGPARVTFKPVAKFRFVSSEGLSTFQCKVDKGAWQRCKSPAKYKVKPGRHVFKVRAKDRNGNVDPTPAQFGWRVKVLGG
jgi:hypothetical protein